MNVKYGIKILLHFTILNHNHIKSVVMFICQYKYSQFVFQFENVKYFVAKKAAAPPQVSNGTTASDTSQLNPIKIPSAD